MPDEYMDAIEPFDYKEMKPFSTAYLPGYLADKYDVVVADCSKRADDRAAETAYRALEASVTGYMTKICINKDILLKRGEVHYAMLPVWLLSTQWKGKNFLFAVNGQTGKGTFTIMEVQNGGWGRLKSGAGWIWLSNPTYCTVGKTVKTTEDSKKSIDELAKEVIRGDWGNGTERKEKLTAAGYDYSVIQKKVNEILK